MSLILKNPNVIDEFRQPIAFYFQMPDTVVD